MDVGIAGAADCLIASGEIPPTAIVTLDGSRVATQGGPNPPMERLVVDEALPYLRAKYPSLAGPAHTSIGGISRGGDWALRIAANRPGTFAAVGGHSPAPELQLDQVRALASQNIRVWLDAGTDDPFLPDVHELAASLRSIGFGSMVMTWPGGHDRSYWSSHVEDYLRFYANAW
ncbi:MAG: alpha/beta hydrolase-fold protein [Aquihabitans sp.]